MSTIYSENLQQVQISVRVPKQQRESLDVKFLYESVEGGLYELLILRKFSNTIFCAVSTSGCRSWCSTEGTRLS